MKIIRYQKIESTQKEAIKRAKNGLAPWTVILAKEQTGGVGRKGNLWYSPKGGLYFSIILPPTKTENVEIIHIITSFYLAKIIYEETNIKPFVKFPNDIYLNKKKVAGILTQNIVVGKKGLAVIGIGVNTNIKNFPKELKKKATSLLLETKKEINNQKFFKKITNTLKKVFEELFFNK